MKRSLFKLVLVAFLFGVTQTQTQAQDDTTHTHAYVPAKVTGKIVSLDMLTPNPWIKIKDVNGAETVVMTAPLITTVWKGEKKVDSDFFKEDQDVVVEFLDNGNKKICIV